jgi:hypothetical protein
MDMHLHSGMERPIALDAWIDWAVRDGRKVVILIDHIELFRVTQEEYEQWARQKGFPLWYAPGAAGYTAMMEEFAEADKRDDVIAFRGWEIYEGELDSGLEKEAMRLADVIGWHISPNHRGDAPDGKHLIKRAKQVKAAQAEFPIPMILFHPFSMRIEHIQRKAREAGRSVADITVEEYRFFQEGEQEELAAILKNSSVYVELSQGNDKYWQDPVTRAALLADVKPLADLGVQFTVSTDDHGLRSAAVPFRPERYYPKLGVTPENANGIVQDLLAIRARKQ